MSNVWISNLNFKSKYHNDPPSCDSLFPGSAFSKTLKRVFLFSVLSFSSFSNINKFEHFKNVINWLLYFLGTLLVRRKTIPLEKLNKLKNQENENLALM